MDTELGTYRLCHDRPRLQFSHAPGAKVGAFVGYNYYNQAINTYGCTQLAGDTGCRPSSPSNLLGLTENDHFISLRIGLSSETMLSDRLRLSADAAYVPWVNFIGLDDHLLRQLLSPDAANSGDGVMLEAILDYNLRTCLEHRRRRTLLGLEYEHRDLGV